MLDLHWRKQWRSPQQSQPSPWCCGKQDDSDPDTTKYQHAENQELGFIECVTHMPVQDSQTEALQSQGG
jgi:hypothetical protein